MIIELKDATIRELFDGYRDDSLSLGAVVGFSGKLNIRPPYQREFIYNEKQRESVIITVMRSLPLNVMYWSEVVDEEERYELIDGQQRTISICQFASGAFSVPDAEGNAKHFFNFTKEEQDSFLDYNLMVYVCNGTELERLAWFKTINIAGEKLNNQELRNAVYTGSWLNDARSKFSRSAAQAYLNGKSIRQDYLETALNWISDGNPEMYMSEHQHDADCDELWQYFQQVISWVQRLFPKYRKEMKGIQWGYLYNQYKDVAYNSQHLETRFNELLVDDEVDTKNVKGIYLYLITGEQKYLSLRTFNDKQKLIAFEAQKGVCPSCGETFTLDQMDGDHIIPWSKGGKTTQDNLQMLCKKCNAQKSNN
jgi:hypothetical protein